MTTQKSFKRRVRARMSKTGESYTAARRMLIASGATPRRTLPSFEPPASETALVKATGDGWDHWLAELDRWGALGRPHGEIVRWLTGERAVAGWWAQSITVGFERARGLRAVGENAGGFVANVSKTVGVPVERLFDAFHDEALRERWLPGAEMRVRTATKPRSARYDWEDGSTRLIAGFDGKSDAKSTVSIMHERLPDADTAAEMKTWWRERLGALKTMLEGDGDDA